MNLKMRVIGPLYSVLGSATFTIMPLYNKLLVKKLLSLNLLKKVQNNTKKSQNQNEHTKKLEAAT